MTYLIRRKHCKRKRVNSGSNSNAVVMCLYGVRFALLLANERDIEREREISGADGNWVYLAK